MYTNFIKNVRRYLDFTEEELAFFVSLMEIRKLKKSEKLLCQGENADYVYYIDKGLLRYYSEIDGKERTYRVLREDMWVSEYAAFLTRKPSMINIEALEETIVLQLHYNKMQEGYEKAKVFERFGRKMAEALFITESEKSSEMRLKSPELRYLELLKNDAELINRVPLKYIASILGIEPESLSRIRKRTARQKVAFNTR